jgi:hypothetical protein
MKKHLRKKNTKLQQKDLVHSLVNFKFFKRT